MKELTVIELTVPEGAPLAAAEVNAEIEILASIAWQVANSCAVGFYGDDKRRGHLFDPPEKHNMRDAGNRTT